jgi:hypothetical protein
MAAPLARIREIEEPACAARRYSEDGGLPISENVGRSCTSRRSVAVGGVIGTTIAKAHFDVRASSSLNGKDALLKRSRKKPKDLQEYNALLTAGAA